MIPDLSLTADRASALPPAARAFLERHFPDAEPALRARRFGQAAVWALARDGQVVAWMKMHLSPGPARRELHALRAWAPGLAAPRLLAYEEGEPVVFAVAHAPGRPVSELSAGDPGLATAFHLAGRALREMHGLPYVDGDRVPLDQALRRRTEAWLARAAPYVSPDIDARVRATVRAALRGGVPNRVPCHRDFQPGNWILAEDASSVQVIDFGHARPDLWLADLVKLLEGELAGAPELYLAFFDGYGRRPGADESRLLAALGALHGVGTLTWGLEHGDEAAARQGRMILDRFLLA